MKKFIVAFALFLTLFATKTANAQEEFLTDTKAVYKINEDGIAEVTHNITIENVFTSVYAKDYQFTLNGINPKNIQITYSGQPLNFSHNKDGKLDIIEFTFPDDVVGRGKSRTFTVSFTDQTIAVKTGDVWEVQIPKIGSVDSFDTYTLELIVPKSFGAEAFVSPDTDKKIETQDKISYSFKKDDLVKSGVTAAFGRFQVYEFDLTFHLENPLNSKSEVQIAIPPDTAFQKVIYKNITPKPETIKRDLDGNWLAIFDLKPREKVDAKAQGFVQIYTIPRPTLNPSLEALKHSLAATKYWQADDPEIVSLAQDLKTPQNIYRFVVDNFQYDYERVTPTTKRLGALAAIRSPKNAICTEFTDTFIALARAAGIPAREINGFAETDNPNLQPLSLVSDVLHAWPEYYDVNQKAWIPVDPTWESTTQGVDYFNKLDLKHITFAIHGKDPEKPFPAGSYKLGKEPQKDVFVKISKLPEERNKIINLKITKPTRVSLKNTDYKFEVENNGPIAVYNQNLKIYYDNKLAKEFQVDSLLPFETFTVNAKAPFGLFGQNEPNSISLVFGSDTQTIKTNKEKDILLQLLLFSTLSLVILSLPFYSLIRHRKK